MTRPLRTEDEITAAGAAAVADFPPLTDWQIDQLVTLLGPLRDGVSQPHDRRHANTSAADAA